MSLRAWSRFLLVLVCAAIFQVAVLDNIVVHYAHADVMMMVAIGAALAAGSQDGAIAAFLTGLVADLFVDTPYGASSLTFVLVAFTVGVAATGPIDKSSMGFRFATAVLGGAAGTLLFAGIGYILDQPLALQGNLVSTVAVVTAGNAILGLPVLAIVRWAFAVPDPTAAATAAVASRVASR